MLQKTIRKDVIGDYEAKLVAGMSARKLIACGCACAVGVGMSFLLGTCWQIDAMTSAYVGVFLTVPVWYLGFFKPYGMAPEVFLPLWFEDMFLEQQVSYVSECTSKLELHIDEVRRCVESKKAKKSRKIERKQPEWRSRPTDRGCLKYTKRLWSKRRRLACVLAAQRDESKAQRS